MAPLEAILAIAYLASLADLVARRGIAALIVSAVAAILMLQGASPVTVFLRSDLTQLAVFVSLVYFAIAAYSHFYMKGAERLGWFWAWMDLFYASMLAFILSDHWALLTVGWAGLDIASWGLILTYRDGYEMGYVGTGERAAGIKWLWPPSTSAFRAIATVEIGTASLLIALATTAAAQGPYLSGWSRLGDLASLLLLIAAFAKAAQLPFTDWLMTAMSAPTPVSALLHSSTMVKAGPILLLKLGHIMPHWAAEAAAIVGITTAFFGGLVALGQREPKLMLAASTASYLGMITALALEKPHEALLLIYAHGVAKAALFMAVGHAIHVEHSRFPQAYPVPAKIAIAAALLILVGVLPTGAAAKNDAPLWTTAVSALTAGYLAKLLRLPTSSDWTPMWLPYAALVVAPNLLIWALPKPLLFLSLGGIALAWLGEAKPLARRFYLPVLYDLIASRAYLALAKFAALVDSVADRALKAAAATWFYLVDFVTVADWLADTMLHGGLVNLVKRASAQLSTRNFDFWLYVAGLATTFLLAVALWLR